MEVSFYYILIKYFAFMDIFILVIIPYQVIFERTQNIRQLLLANRVGYFSYYMSLFLLHFLVQLFFNMI